MPELNHLNSFDHLIVVVYMLMVAGVGVYVSRFNKKTDDYFKGGGHIPWGLSAVSLFVSGFSAFMFVGAAGFTYNNGGAAFILFSLALPAYLLGYFVYGRLWRRTRIDTPMEFLGRRYSPATTYFYTILSVLPNILLLGTMIYTLCIFISTATGFSGMDFDLGIVTLSGFELTLLGTGTVMVFYTLIGGLWAVMVTDALQFIILFLVSLIILPVAFSYLGDGSIIHGVERLVTEAPEGYFSLELTDRPRIFWFAYFTNIVLGYNVNWHIAQRYYSVPDERDTRKMAMWCAWMSIILPMLWVIPVMASRVMFPELESMWPDLAVPSEAAFVTLALTVLPHGLMGVMVAAIFAATMSSVDTTFNWMAAVVTKDVYVPVTKFATGDAPSDKTQLIVGKLSVAIMGLLSIWIALSMERFGGAFDVYLRANSLYSPPMFIPVILGLVFTRTPWWSGMVAFGGGVLCVLLASVAANLSQGMPVGSFGDIFTEIRVVFLGIEMERYEINTLTGIFSTIIFFFGSALFNRRTGTFLVRITSLEKDLRTPAHAESDSLDLRGLLAYRLAGRLSLVIGALLLIYFVFNPGARLAWLNIIGGVLAVAIGTVVLFFTKRYLDRHASVAAQKL